MKLRDLFEAVPTRSLEEVQKVRDYDQLEKDVREFHETDSACRVLQQLGKEIETPRQNEPRFLYIQATFGSGKTHLLKLTGLVADKMSEHSDLGDELANQWPGFDDLSQAVDESEIEYIKPVFLNLLDRDASKEPPLPFIVFAGIGREFGYPTDPNWLLEWVWRLDTEYDGVWQALQEYEYNGKTFWEVLDGKAFLRSWLYDAVSSMPDTEGTDLDSADRVKESIENAVDEVDPQAFDAEELVRRVETAQNILSNRADGRAELMLGLDEVALFVGDNTHRYREFEETVEALQQGPNPVVVATGQYSLPATRRELVGDVPENHWVHDEILLEGTDTEIIVRKRWLEKDNDVLNRIEDVIEGYPDLSLEMRRDLEVADPNPVEAYPFRDYDLTLLREVMQELITQGRETDRDYIQGRAMLVLVRALFTKFGWDDAELGELVTWDVIYDLLVEETPYVPLWVQEMISNTVIPTYEHEEDSIQVRVSKALYLLNQSTSTPSTKRNLTRLMFTGSDETLESVESEVEDSLNDLEDKRLVLSEESEDGKTVYKLVSEEQESVLERAQKKAQEVSPHQLSAWLQEKLKSTEGFFKSPNTRHDEDIGEERLVPLRYQYSVLDSIDKAPTPEHDSINVRVLADDSDTLQSQVETWQEVNLDRDGGEHLLVTITVEDPLIEHIRQVIGMDKVLSDETESHEDLEREYRKNERRLESDVSEVIDDASLYTLEQHEGSLSSNKEETIQRVLSSEFGPTRKILSQPLAELDDAKAIAKFFRGTGDWPWSTEDAAMLGVDLQEQRITDEGWTKDFIEENQDKTSLDVESILREIASPKGRYRGTPEESIAALLITLALSNEKVALKKDTEFLTDPEEIGRNVRTKNKLQSLQVRFGVEILDPKKTRRLVESVTGETPSGEGPDEWLSELSTWADSNSADVKRTLKLVEREFDISLESLKKVLDPALSGGEIEGSDLGDEDQFEQVLAEAEEFSTAHEVLSEREIKQSVWQRFKTSLDRMESLYPAADITRRMQETASTPQPPSKETLDSRIEDARSHRLSYLSEIHTKITGTPPDEDEADAILGEIVEWIQSHEDEVQDILDSAEDEFESVSLYEIRQVFSNVWRDGSLPEEDLVGSGVKQQVERFERCRELLDDFDGVDLWSNLEQAAVRLREEHPESPTTEEVEELLTSSEPPSVSRVQQMLEETEDPRIAGDDDEWYRLQRQAEKLKEQLPNSDVTSEVSSAISGEDRPSPEHIQSLLKEADELLERYNEVTEALDDLEDGSIVLIEDTRSD